MYPAQIYTLTLLRMADIEEQARTARRRPGPKRASLRSVLSARLRRTDDRGRGAHAPLAGVDGRAVAPGR